MLTTFMPCCSVPQGVGRLGHRGVEVGRALLGAQREPHVHVVHRVLVQHLAEGIAVGGVREPELRQLLIKLLGSFIVDGPVIKVLWLATR